MWRVANALGRRHQREHDRLLHRLSGAVGVCQRCGKQRPAEELAVKGFGPWVKIVCRDGCEGEGK
ncbi:hypothetical protein [Thermoanaerobaculum aquaticum]|uniref:hypothetical protein n=1 Tax=Thermoanaerobaculum aquaticum TaxID=1312852 RepID=UPI001377D285|nr:hypothetical protein [Thermoanaerobaculum aquaticum]